MEVSGGDLARVLRGGRFERTLSQVIEQAGQAVGGLEEQLQGCGFKRIGMNAGFGQAGLDIGLGIGEGRLAPFA